MPKADKREETTVDRAERLLIEDILDGTYPPNTYLPGERPLSKTLEVARPALREALQRLNHDGWLEIQQGKPTRVRDFLHEGNLNILTGLFKVNPGLMPDLVSSLLEVWALFAPAYAVDAIRRAPGLIIDQLESCTHTDEQPEAFADAMWGLHRALIGYCGNPIYALIFNSFDEFYRQLAMFYYADSAHRGEARKFWEALWAAAHSADARRASKLMGLFMQNILAFWKSGGTDDFRKEVRGEAASDEA